MSTTVELVRANERYARLRAAAEGLAAEWEHEEAYACNDASECVRCVSFQRVVIRLRALLAAVDS